MFDEQKQHHEHSEWISDHLLNYFDSECISVFHEIPALDFRMDVYLIRVPNRNYQVLMTTGMSVIEMNIDEDVEEDVKDGLKFAELMMLVPKDITFNDAYTGENPNDWIITMLKMTAKFPHYHNTWLGEGHSIQANMEYQPYSNDSQFYGAVILPSATFRKDFTKIRREGRVINLYTLFPVYKNELEYRREHGFSAFWKRLVKANPKETLNVRRPNILEEL